MAKSPQLTDYVRLVIELFDLLSTRTQREGRCETGTTVQI